MNRQSVRRSTSGFTLVELLVVIVIIGILVGLLIPVLGMARASVQKSAVTSEVAALTQAMQAFKTQYQTDYPPDFSGPIRLSTGEIAVDGDANVINEFLRRTHRYRSTNDFRVDFSNLDPAEALVFWLRGFTDDQEFPLYGPDPAVPDQAVQRTPLFEFDESRLADKDNDGFQEYYPRYGSDLPYVYLVHGNYRGAFLADPKSYRAAANPTAGVQGFACPRPYLRADKDFAPSGLAVYDVPGNYASPDKFQVIACGLDNSFGLQFDYQSFAPFRFPEGPYPDKAHLDNVTNFSEGALEDRLP